MGGVRAEGKAIRYRIHPARWRPISSGSADTVWVQVTDHSDVAGCNQYHRYTVKRVHLTMLKSVNTEILLEYRCISATIYIIYSIVIHIM